VAIHVDRGGGEEVLREAIACGADHGILIDGTLGFEGDAASRAALIADVVRAYGPFDAVLGPAWSEFGGFTGTLPAVAGQLDLPCVVGVTSIKVESFSFLIGYDSLFGTYDLRIPRPAVVVVGDVQADDPTAWGVRAAWETGIQRIQADARSLHKPLTKRLRIEAVKEEKRTVETVDGATLVRRMRSRGLLGDPEATA
jgi:electron transfer flavoprotein alpha/beta subunit